jgi:DNA polymerase
MGAAKAVGYAKGAIDRGTADKIVATYRAENSHIVQFWKDIERAVMYTFKYKRATELRGLRLYAEDDCNVVIRLQSGRCLFYESVRLGRDQYDREKLEIYNAMLHTWEPVWGGAFTENIVQARCRDILMEAQLRIPYRTVLRVHDELVLMVPTEQAEEALAVAIREMTRAPAWAPGLPLAAEGSIKDRYCK